MPPLELHKGGGEEEGVWNERRFIRSKGFLKEKTTFSTKQGKAPENCGKGKMGRGIDCGSKEELRKR